MRTYTELPAYVRAVNKRDQILEVLLLKFRAKESDQLRRFINLVMQHVSRYYPLLNKQFLDPHTITQMRHLELSIEHSSKQVMSQVLTEWEKLRRMTYAFSWAASQKALLNAGLDSKPVKLPAARLAHHITKKSDLIGALPDRVHLAFERLKRKVIDAVQMSRAMGESHEEAMVRAGKAFPAAQRLKRQNVLTRSFVERDSQGRSTEKDPFQGPDFIDADQWDQIREEYGDAFIPDWRDPRYEFGANLSGDEATIASAVKSADEGGYIVYPWQVEQEMTEDFVASVRAGEVDAANEQGITNFVWIAVLSAGHTCEACRKRDGLLNSEIEAKLETEWKDDENDSVVPPAHPNCYCRIAPATDDLPEKPASNAQSIEDWFP